jgi:hypothetical protein
MSNRNTKTHRVRATARRSSLGTPSRGRAALRALLVATRMLAMRAPAPSGHGPALGRWAGDKRRMLAALAQRGPRALVELPVGAAVAARYARELVADLVAAGLVESIPATRPGVPATLAITDRGQAALHDTSKADVELLALEHTTLSAEDLDQAAAVIVEITRAIAARA